MVSDVVWLTLFPFRRFIHTVVLWKRPPEQKSKSMPRGKFDRYYNVNCFVVKGKISDVLYTKNGVPYFGGSVFCVFDMNLA